MLNAIFSQNLTEYGVLVYAMQGFNLSPVGKPFWDGVIIGDLNSTII